MSRAVDLMTREPTTILEDAMVGEAIRLLQALQVRHLPVLNQQGDLVGMLSDRDVRAASIPTTVDKEWLGELRFALQTPVARVMTCEVVTVEEETETAEIIELMLENKIGAIPVLDADGELVGIVSYMDVLRELYELERDAA